MRATRSSTRVAIGSVESWKGSMAGAGAGTVGGAGVFLQPAARQRRTPPASKAFERDRLVIDKNPRGCRGGEPSRQSPERAGTKGIRGMGRVQSATGMERAGGGASLPGDARNVARSMPNGAPPPTCPVQHATPPGFFATPGAGGGAAAATWATRAEGRCDGEGRRAAAGVRRRGAGTWLRKPRGGISRRDRGRGECRSAPSGSRGRCTSERRRGRSRRGW